jgi:TonB family protein
VSFRVIHKIMAAALLAGGLVVPAAKAQEETTRKIKSQIAPTYPELARKMNITGTVKLQLTVAPNGTVKYAKVVGGHPVLATAAMDTVKKWKYEPAKDESTTVVEFRFDPNQN